MHEDRFAFNRGAIRPLECLTGAWQLVKDEYWFFLGVTFVGALVGGAAPFGILLGPAMCGIHICLLRRSHGQPVKFDMLFQGFNYFGQSLIATMLMMGPLLVIVLVWYAMFVGGTLGIIAFAEQQRQAVRPPNDAAAGFLMLGFMGLMIFGLLFVSFLFQAVFIFTYPLIVDRELTGVEAVRLSFRAFRGNFGGVLGVIFLGVALSLVGLLLCFFGVYLTLPIGYAMITIAYHQVFPTIDPYEDLAGEPDSPAPYAADEDEDAPRRKPSRHMCGRGNLDTTL